MELGVGGGHWHLRTEDEQPATQRPEGRGPGQGKTNSETKRQMGSGAMEEDHLAK